MRDSSSDDVISKIVSRAEEPIRAEICGLNAATTQASCTVLGGDLLAYPVPAHSLSVIHVSNESLKP